MHSVRLKDVRKKWRATFNVMSHKQANINSTASKFDHVKKSLRKSGSTGTSYASSTLTHSVRKSAPSFEMESILTSTLKKEEEMVAEKVELQVDIQYQDYSLDPILEKQEFDSLRKKDLSTVCSLVNVPAESDDNEHDEVELAQKESLSMKVATNTDLIPSQDEVCVCEKLELHSNSSLSFVIILSSHRPRCHALKRSNCVMKWSSR